MQNSPPIYFRGFTPSTLYAGDRLCFRSAQGFFLSWAKNILGNDQEFVTAAVIIVFGVTATVEICSRKYTTLRYVLGKLHPSEHKVILVTDTSGSIMKIYRQILR